MLTGKRFVDDHPKIGSLLDRLYKKRELDYWYKERCKEGLDFENELYKIKSIENVDVRNFVEPNVSFYLQLKDIKGTDGFSLTREILLRVSKIAPVYTLYYVYSFKHRAFDGNVYNLNSESAKFPMDIKITLELTRLMKAKGYIQLSHHYDLNDTVYRWDELPHIEAFNRSLTLEDALFEDVLGLCP